MPTVSTRPMGMGRSGMVSSPHYLATQAGVLILERGGSAADAAVAVNAVLSVVYPHMTGVGGDALWLLYDAKSNAVHALNGSGRAAQAATLDRFAQLGFDEIPSTGPLSAITVPGAVDSWAAASERFGVLGWDELLAPAIAHARRGVPTAAGVVRFVNEHHSVLRRYPATARAALMVDGQTPSLGDVMHADRLAETLETLATKGRDAFYAGPVAEEIVSSLQEAGGLLTMQDFEMHSSSWEEPLVSTYREATCYQHPPNSQGIVHLLMLNVIEGFDLAGMGDQSAEYLHVVTEATKLAYAERERHITDPDRTDPDQVAMLLSKEYAAELRSRIRLDDALPATAQMDPHGDTTCTVVVDKWGNAASVIQSICHAYGSAFVAGNSGVLLHNRGSKFSLQEGHVNRLEPGTRTMHTLMPSMAFKDDQPWLIYGTMGGDGQPQTNTSTITKMVDFKYSAQAAVEAPRTLYGQFWGDRTNELWIENRLANTVAEHLKHLGHSVKPVDDWADIMGHAQAIEIDHKRGITMGGSDPRGDGLALGPTGI